MPPLQPIVPPGGRGEASRPVCVLMANLRGKPDILARTGLNPAKMPRHVAIIMDGNGRWAQKRGLPRSLGHRAGVERLKGIIRTSSDIGLEALTLYAFSTENWKRPAEEVDALCGLFVEFFKREFDELHFNGVVIRAIGDVSAFPQRVSELIYAAQEKTASNDGLKLNIAMNYGSHAEILRAVNLAAATGRTDWDPESFSDLLYTRGLPEVDLLIRTGGEQRVSNFLLFQAAYAELMFTDAFWPDFSDELYLSLLGDFQKRSRRFGAVEAT